MSSARIAVSRHVGLSRAGASVAPLRREVGGGSGISIRGSRVAAKARWKAAFGIDRRIAGQLRWQSGISSSEPQVQAQQTPQPNPDTAAKKPLSIRLPLALALTLFTFGAGFIMAGAPAVESIRAMANPPTDAETLELFQPPTEEVAEIERNLFSHPLTKRLLADPKYIAARPHLKIPEALRHQNLTGGTLLGPDKIAVPPLQFTTEDGSSFVSIQYLGTALCGHPGIVHGGLLATLLDEGLARCCFPALPNKVAVTASLKIDYKAPVMAGQIIVLRAEMTKVEGRKAWVKGWLETLADESKGEKAFVLTEGEALFIEPKHAASLKRVVN
ncbi:Thioesterase/thiol ester dehydrase-isomerase [Cucurbitaria berberidis CBS 394.84]|uniref:Thioesterase/thiol ester dehydrase-isomerase n=1 Tax=Cucurbitaria berberidis CBS 394.84 TaxID=1168544 RepID=A0A9P4G8C7_9PLEO|nr:Thioesterase/thiol ester dehydrase-isomerase [Cucurbitaria berberidis CBS 394.84]KAF1840917.1 Thioesterase/thiol ester dehydrase-isomerase [Cucurbitaria berberidis CBS 394.84]